MGGCGCFMAGRLEVPKLDRDIDWTDLQIGRVVL